MYTESKCSCSRFSYVMARRVCWREGPARSAREGDWHPELLGSRPSHLLPSSTGRPSSAPLKSEHEINPKAHAATLSQRTIHGRSFSCSLFREGRSHSRAAAGQGTRARPEAGVTPRGARRRRILSLFLKRLARLPTSSQPRLRNGAILRSRDHRSGRHCRKQWRHRSSRHPRRPRRPPV